MSRYVKADMIGCPCGYCEGYDECQKEVDDAPSIDIVFCKECGKHNTHRCHMAFDLVATNDDDFCSYGCRKEE